MKEMVTVFSSEREAAILVAFLLLFIIWLWRRQHSAGRLNLPPGPRPLPIVGNLHQLTKLPHRTFYSLSQQFGPIVHLRLGSVPLVVASSADAARQFLQVQDHNFCRRPETVAGKILAYNLAGIVLSPRNRSDLKKLFSLHLVGARRLEESRPVRHEELGLLVKALMEDSQHNRTANLYERVLSCTTNIIARLVINRRLMQDDVSGFHVLAQQLVTYLGGFVLEDVIPWLGWLDVGGTKKKMRALHRQLDEFLERVISTYRAERENLISSKKYEEKDILDAMLSLAADTSGANHMMLNDTVIKAIMLDIFIAGSRTSMIIVHWTMAELLRNPEVRQKAQQELDEVIGSNRMLAEFDLPQLPYLHAIVKETCRLHPPSPLLLPHEAVQDCKVMGYDIMQKTRLFVNVWAMGRDPSIWEDPHHFNPDRFISNMSHIDMKGQNFELIPFGSGRRICPGLTMGLTIVHYVLATLLHAFEWALPTGQLPQDIDMIESPGIGLNKATPVEALPIPRLPKYLYYS